MNTGHFKSTLSRHLRNIPGRRINRRILVIESDDWGSIRMPSKSVYDSMLKGGIRVNECAYNRYDSLASADDLSCLFEVLTSFKDIHDRHVCFTANAIMANPDFDKIRESGFEKYFFELFPDTLKRYPGRTDSFRLWKTGIAEGIFFPQLHGREHLNIGRWMKGLQQGLKETKLAFDHQLFGISTTITSEKRDSYLAAFDYDDTSQRLEIENIVLEGADLFEKLFSYRSASFIAPNYVWDPSIEKVLGKIGVRYLQGARVQQVPKGSGQKNIRHRMGDKNEAGQLFLVRNCLFEPSITGGNTSVEQCLSEIDAAFRWQKPAVISSHRLNYIGSIVPSNRDKNLHLLRNLLFKVKKKWPDVEFLNTAELGQIMNTN